MYIETLKGFWGFEEAERNQEEKTENEIRRKNLEKQKIAYRAEKNMVMISEF